MRYLLFIISTVLIVSACQKEIVIPQGNYQSKLSIQGFVEPDSFPKVYVHHTLPFLGTTVNNADIVVRDAVVKINKGNQSQILSLDSMFNPIKCDFEYFYTGNEVIEWNQPYHLEITWQGSIYEADATTNLEKVVIDSIAYTQAFNDVYGEHEGVITYFKDPVGPGNYFRFQEYRQVDSSLAHASIKLSLQNDCILGDTIFILELGRSVYNDENNDGNQIKIVVEPAYTHREGIESVIKIQSIDANIYKFYDQLDQQKLAQFNPFVEPVFLRDGQFGDKAFGFFGALTRSEGVSFTYPE